MDIAVVANPNSEGLSQGTYEAIAFAAALAGKADAKVTLWLLGADCQKGIREAARLPIEAAICAEHGALADYMPETYLDALTQMQQAYRPDMIVFSGDIAGREISVRLACRADTQAVNDCIAGDYQDGAFVFTKSVYSGNLFIRYVLAQKPAIVSIRNGVFDGKGVKRTDGSCIVRRFEYAPKVSCSWVRHRELKKKANDLLSDARIVVIGGRGIGRRENFGLLQRFAEKIGAAVGGTRPAVNNGWLPVDAL
ncbi:MAG: electron transfer flavoprotein subunit alpha/FixB family protein, partial [Synergistales bacterium]|nr:electron transfer flavoprotein subunit alpha/FixB family protein [Synergistales bacterium]